MNYRMFVAFVAVCVILTGFFWVFGSAVDAKAENTKICDEKIAEAPTTAIEGCGPEIRKFLAHSPILSSKDLKGLDDYEVALLFAELNKRIEDSK